MSQPAQPFVTINIGAPPTIHTSCTRRDLLLAADALRDWVLDEPVQPTQMAAKAPPAEDWAPTEILEEDDP